MDESLTNTQVLDRSISIVDWSPKSRVDPNKKKRIIEHKDPHITKKEFREIFTDFMKPRQSLDP